MSTTYDRDGVRERLLRAVSSRRANLGVSAGPALAWLFFLLLAPLTFMVTVSFMTVNESYAIVWEPTLANYSALLSGDGAFWQTSFFKSLLLSYFIAAVTTVLCLTLALPLAYLLARRGGRTFKVVIFLVLLPFFTMYLVRAYSWFLMFGPSGVINDTLLTIGVVSEPLGLFNFGVPAIIVGLTHAYFPYMLLSLYASLDGVDFSLVEASRDLGAGRFEAFKDVVLPLILPGMISGSLFVFVPSLGAFITPRFLGQGKVLMIGQLIESRINSLYAIGYGSAASMFIIVSIVVAFALAFRYVSIEELGGA
ncbi:ABC transporter permease [Halogeometricum borinquense]|uniref:ABC-type spermidine/putrescine transport system, permease component I n=2 Tax=Halogeometricum borinquense TaxID=60847 RepID=E4NLK3_HALBP|nr:ABC transporter permease [Halogeometricum borinquense]ADQ67206.1 ABC-type spermidine/putrescine transport system, permease component I [Halogeometricum borinquense DSM 11551]ELY29753.1 spermidine/putrescine ABC transporter permease [Halogeometricum borinquense DSM 11551]QIB74559.1 ABC transporter permease [Halogeometricum borinquense]QIQ76496.1 ABC transporter permease [Halogeometricum borinquense]RYJ13841.1 ABC transporter permease [Halogeometricum borinquense]